MQAEPKCERMFWDNGNIRKEEFRNQNGNRHNAAGPAVRYWHEDGKIGYEVYYLNGKLHNAAGPAAREWYENGKLVYESYYLNGKRHNADGPAFRYWPENGKLVREAHYLHGRKLTYHALLQECPRIEESSR